MSRAPLDFRWEVGELPFYWGPLREPSNGDGLPDALPFVLELRSDSGLLVQASNLSVQGYLRRVYDRGSMISGMMDDSGIGLKYTDDFLDFVTSVRSGSQLATCRVLEIGCGTGYLLSRMKAHGADVLGVEPGSQALDGAQRFDVPIIRDFFPTSKVAGKFDLIILYGVLEHLEDPHTFVEKIRPYLVEGGQCLLSVPDCGPYLEAGDINILLHEHWSYFTTKSLANLLTQSGAQDIEIRSSTFGGALYATFSISASNPQWNLPVASNELQRAHRFRQLAISSNERLQRLIAQASSRNQSVGVYVPGRIVNTLAVCRVDPACCRFFDDNKALHGTYFPGIPIPVESRDNLRNDPTDYVLVMTRTFGRQLKRELAKIMPEQSRIIMWDEIFQIDI